MDNMKRQKIEEIIKQYCNEGYFSYFSPSRELIQKVESILKISLPIEFLWFVKKFGSGGINGTYIFGISESEHIDFLEETLHYREQGLPNNLIVIENCDEWVYCIDCNNGKILMWSSWEGESDYCHNNFYEFLLDEFRTAVEALE